MSLYVTSLGSISDNRKQREILKKLLIAIVMVWSIFLQTTSPISFATNPDQVVRVVFPNFKNLSEETGDGLYSGYLYEYLMEISKYTGWTYEFITGTEDQLVPLMEMLETGEADVMGGIVKNEESMRLYDFPEFSTGASYTTLSTLENSTRFSEGDYQTYNGMRVGVFRNASQRRKKLEQFCEINGIKDMTTVSYASGAELFRGLEENEVDAVLLSDISVPENNRVIARFGADPFYFAITKGRTDLVNGFNMAISKIKESDSSFDSDLYEKYFPMKTNGSLVLSEEERAYIETCGPVSVAAGLQTAPLDYFDKNGEFKGISADILKKITELTGLQFHIVEAKNQEEAYKMLREGRAQLVTSVFDNINYAPLEDITVLSPYLSAPMTMVMKNDMAKEDIGHSAMGITDNRSLKAHVRNENYIVYNSLEECMKAVNRGEVDYCYGNAYSVEYYKRSHAMDKLTLLTMPNNESSVCLGIKAPADIMLMGILNKAVSHISEGTLQQIIFDNTSKVQYSMSFSALLRMNIWLVISMVSGFFLLIILIITWFYRKRRVMQEQFYQYYRNLGSLMKEILFEYDCRADCLTLTEKDLLKFGLQPVTKNFMKRFHNGEWPELRAQIVPLIEEGVEKKSTEMTKEMKLQLPDGTNRWYRVTVAGVWDSKGKFTHLIGRAQNIDREFEEKERLTKLAQQDTLTGLYNKGATERLCSEYFSDEEGNRFGALLMIDVDNFKFINDNYGHQCGDNTLKKLSEIMKKLFQTEDVLGRIGGDEFVALAKNVQNKAEAGELAENVIKAFGTVPEEPFQDLSGSIGIAFFPEDGTDYAVLYHKADCALYAVKQSGKCGYRFYDDSMDVIGKNVTSISSNIDSDRQ